MDPNQPAVYRTTDLQRAAYLIYKGARLDRVEPTIPGRYEFVLSDIPARAADGPQANEQVELRLFLKAQRELKSLLTLARRGVAWRAR